MSETTVGHIAVLGCGGWGTALAVHLSSIGQTVRLWGRDRALIERMVTIGTNEVYLPGVLLPPSLCPTADLEAALYNAQYIVVAVPSHGTRETMNLAAPHFQPQATIVSAVKGLEETTLLRMSEVIKDEVGTSRAVAVLSGPSFAVEVARGSPTAVVVAGDDSEVVRAVQRDFRSGAFRLYGTDDVIGVEIGGALKNVIAIAAGVVEALGLGHNALAAIITRGLAEISRLACASGGRRDTLSGLSGLGDLVLTCTGALSRNRRVGIELGKGRSLDDVLAEMQTVAEGVRTTHAALQLGRTRGAELPITAQMSEVLAGHKTPRAASEELMLRPQRSENDQ